MSGITSEMRERMQAIQGNIGHTRVRSSRARTFVHDGDKVVEVERPKVMKTSCYPFPSTQMACQTAEDVAKAMEQIKRHARGPARFTEFDDQFRPIITSTAQQHDLAMALGYKSGAHGYGYTDEHGRFQNTGRRRTDEIQEGRAKVRKAIDALHELPEEVHISAVDDVLKPLSVDHPVEMGSDYDFEPTEENTG